MMWAPSLNHCRAQHPWRGREPVRALGQARSPHTQPPPLRYCRVVREGWDERKQRLITAGLHGRVRRLMDALLWGCRARLGGQQGPVVTVGVAEVCQEASKAQLVIVGLQRGAATPFNPAGVQSGLWRQDGCSGAAWVLHTPRARGPYLRTGAVFQAERETLGRSHGSSSASPNSITQGLWHVLGDPIPHLAPGARGGENFQWVFTSWFAPAEFQCVFFLLKTFIVIKLQTKPISKGKRVGMEGGTDGGGLQKGHAHMHRKP